MVRETGLHPEVEVLWEDFHAEVNVPSEQLRTWLLTRGSGEESFSPNPDLDLPQPGREILKVLQQAQGRSDPGGHRGKPRTAHRWQTGASAPSCDLRSPARRW